MGWYVSRQSNYYDQGAYSVEIASQFDYAGPGMLVAKFADEGCEFDDPREAAEAAVRVSEAWGATIANGDPLLPLTIGITLVGNAFVYATVEDSMTAAEAREWAEGEWEAAPKCERCGNLAPAADNKVATFTGETFTACSDFCADEIVAHDMDFDPDDEECCA